MIGLRERRPARRRHARRHAWRTRSPPACACACTTWARWARPRVPPNADGSSISRPARRSARPANTWTMAAVARARPAGRGPPVAARVRGRARAAPVVAPAAGARRCVAGLALSLLLYGDLQRHRAHPQRGDRPRQEGHARAARAALVHAAADRGDSRTRSSPRTRSGRYLGCNRAFEEYVGSRASR